MLSKVVNSKTKIVTIVGARPQFIKAAAISRVIRDEYAGTIEEILVHTGQHYNENMSNVFFKELNIPCPQYHLGITGCSHGAMTGQMLEAIEQVLLVERPDWILIYGDTNSTLAGALAAVKLHIPIAHVETGLRSFNRRMPEEINRILCDRLSTLLFCPSEAAVKNLQAEGINRGVHNVGDVMYDVALFYRDKIKKQDGILQNLDLVKRSFVLATCHRAENTDDPDRLKEIVSALADIAKTVPVVLPLHPRTHKCIHQFGLEHYLTTLKIIDPVSFLEMIALEQAAQVILTDSGGVQKEAFFYGIPCVTMRDETEWVETVELGWNQLAGANRDNIVKAFAKARQGNTNSVPYGLGKAGAKIVATLVGTNCV